MMCSRHTTVRISIIVFKQAAARVLGGAAVVEVHRAITGGGNRDVAVLRQKEETLRRQLQELQKELLIIKTQRELTEHEAAQLAKINAHLQQTNGALEKETTTLKTENGELVARTEQLIERQQLLEQCAESLKLENSLLIQQFDRLKLKHEQESLIFERQLQELKQRVGHTLQQFTNGEVTAQELVHALSEMGVELKVPEGEDILLHARLNGAHTIQERSEALQHLELEIEESWLHQMRMVMSSPNRVVRLMTSASGVPTSPRTHRSLETPRAVEAVQQKTTAAKLASHAVHADIEESGIIAAVHPVEEGSGAALEAPAVAEERKESARARSLMFRPLRKAVKRMTSTSKQTLVEVEGPVEMVPRLSLNFAEKEDAQLAGNAMVAL